MALNDLKNVAWHLDGNVGVLTLNRPDRLNAIDNATIDDLAAVVAAATHDENVRAVVITGAGRAFCAGADVQEWDAGSEAAPEDQEPWPPKMHRVMTSLYWMPKPVVAAVNGVAVGAGCDLALVADMRFGSTAARFGEIYMRLGFCPDAGGSYLLPRIVGESRAAEMIYTGRIIDAAEAERIGLVTEIVEPDALLDRAMEQARIFASGPTVAIGIAKQNIRKNHTATFEDALRNELRGGDLCGKTEDHVEGMRATIDRRQPEFVGR
ncbi:MULTISPECIES: enoyl-CoA hydratase/isomerase family protein [unclassified Blastococcus]